MFTEIFTDDLSVTIGNPTKASEYNNLANNTDALKERLIVGHHMNDTGVTDEDGFHKGLFSDPMWLYAKGLSKYGGLFIDTTVTGAPILRLALGSVTAAPAGATLANQLILGASGILIMEGDISALTGI